VRETTEPLTSKAHRGEKDAAPAAFPRLARVLDCSIFYGLLGVIALTAIPYGTVQPWWVAFFECLVFVIAILAVIETLVGQRRPLDLSLAAPLLVLILFVLFQSLPLFSGTGPISVRISLSADPYGTWLLAIKLFAMVVTALLLMRHSSSRARLRVLIYFVIGIGVGTACFGLIRRNLQTGPGFLLPGLPSSQQGFAQFINRNHFAFLIEMSLGLCVGLIVGEIRRYQRVLVLLVLSALMWVALIYSNSRGGIVASLCQLVFLAVLLDPIRHLTQHDGGGKWQWFRNVAGGMVVRVVLIVSLIFVFAYGVAWVGGEQVVSNFEVAGTGFDQPGLEIRENTRRKQIWSSTWKMIKAHPITGTGFGGYWIGITEYHDASGEFTPQEAHNDYLELLASGGVIGLALASWFAVVFISRARNNLRSPDRYLRGAALGALSGIFGVMIHSFVDFGLHITINALVFCILIVIAAHNRTGNGQAIEQVLTPSVSR
jgi:O-antigen ligase